GPCSARPVPVTVQVRAAISRRHAEVTIVLSRERLRCGRPGRSPPAPGSAPTARPGAPTGAGRRPGSAGGTAREWCRRGSTLSAQLATAAEGRAHAARDTLAPL